MAARTLVVDDHELFREGLCALLSGEPSIEVIGQALDARTALRMATDLHPDLAIVDLSLPGTGGIGLVRDLVRLDKACCVLVLTMHVSEPFVTQAFANGAKGYALKDQPSQEILEAVRAVANGQAYLAPRFPRELLDKRALDATDPLAVLSRREREVFDLAVRGFSNESAAAELGVSVKTLETHRARINRKLRVHSTADLVRFAAQHGLLSRMVTEDKGNDE